MTSSKCEVVRPVIVVEGTGRVADAPAPTLRVQATYELGR
jgi:hypothetical protein